jgi:hypothetical protein
LTITIRLKENKPDYFEEPKKAPTFKEHAERSQALKDINADGLI